MHKLRASSQGCAECARYLLQQVRRASTSTAGSSSSYAREAHGRDVYGRKPAGMHQSWRAAAPSQASASRPSTPSIRHSEQRRDPPKLRPPPAKSVPKDYYVEKDTKQAPKNVNFAQGSALAAFMGKAAKEKAAASSMNARPSASHAAPSQSIRKAQPLRTPQRPLRRRAMPNKRINIPAVTSVATLAKLTQLKLRRLQLLMERMGMTDTRPDRLLNAEDASLVALELGFNAITEDESAFDIYPAPPAASDTLLPLRPPIITIMGHVDHGKTSLLDALRSTKVAAGEAGGITQHIGAFSVPLSALLSDSSTATNAATSTSAGSLTFLDTPGHAAFTAMRSRGASVTDVVVLVVAADDGVKPQTEEVIKLIKNEDVGIVVAVTKCDKPGIDTARVFNELLVQGLEVEQIGGDIPCVEVSAHSKQGLPDLVETINAVAEVRDLRAEQSGITSEGRVIESRKEVGRGNVATVIVTRGTLKTGATIIAGKSFARVRMLTSSDNKTLSEAGPGTPVEVTGWKDLPEAGDEVLEAADEEVAKKAIDTRKRREERLKTMGDLDVINEKRRVESESMNLAKQMAEEAKAQGEDSKQDDILASLRASSGSGVKELRILIKADVSGTVEAVTGALADIGNSEAKVRILKSGVGDVTDSDLTLAKAAEGIVVGFNVKASRPMMATAATLGVPILTNDVIYRLIEDVTNRVIDLLPKLFDERVLGEASIQQIFQYKLKGGATRAIAGCRVTNGSIQRKAKIKLLRGKEVLFKGDIDSLKHIKADIDEAKKGTECGLNLAGFEGFQAGDVLQSYEEVQRVRTL